MPIKVLHLSTHNEACGIGKYQEMFLQAMEGNSEVENVFFEISPSAIPGMSPEARREAFETLRERLKDFDVLHVQHEYTYFPDDTLVDVCRIAKDAGKSVVVTVHTGIAALNKWGALNIKTPRDVARFIKRNLQMRAIKAKIVQSLVEALNQADLVLVHNEKTKADLVANGVSKRKFKNIVIPVPVVRDPVPSNVIGSHLRANEGDRIIGVVGFINKLKGTADAVEALALLPSNYKLAIIGGLHPKGAPPFGDQSFLDGLVNRIQELGLTDRVWMTGYVENDDELNALVRECDLCAYPYDRVQYGNSSSAALNNAFANHRPVVTYPTEPFKEINTLGGPYLQIAKDFTPGEIARTIRQIDLHTAQKMSTEFSERFSYPVVAGQLAGMYGSLVS